MSINFVYINMGIDKWPNTKTTQNFEKLINSYSKTRINRIQDHLYNLVEKGSQPTSLAYSKDGTPMSTKRNFPDYKGTSCYIKNRFFQLYNQKLAESIHNNVESSTVFILSEFCHPDFDGKNVMSFRINDSKKDVNINKLLDTLQMHSYHLQYYGSSKRFRNLPQTNDIKKYFATGTTYDNNYIITDESSQDTKHKNINNEELGNRKDKYFGVIQISILKSNDNSFNEIVIVNIHNRFYKVDEFKDALDDIFNKRYKEHNNIIFIGDLNIRNNNIPFKEDDNIYTMDNLDEYMNNINFIKHDIDAIYNAYIKKCDFNRKMQHLILYSRLDNFNLSLKEVNCNLQFKTSSHHIIRFTLDKKN